MNFTKGIVKSLLGLALALTIGATAFAADGPGKRNHDPLQRLQSKLNLSADQVAQLKPTFEQMKQKHQAERAQFKSKLQSILTPDQLAKLEANKGEHRRGGMKDLNLSDDQKAQMKGLWGQKSPEMKAERERMQAQILAVLTPEQQAKYKEMQQHKGRHHNRGGNKD